MRFKIPIFFCIGVLGVLLMPKIVQAATFYIAPDGSDTNNGTITSPYKTFQPAVTQANPGDTIYVRGGTYTEANTMVNNVERDWDSRGATSCPAGQHLTDSYCFYDVKTFIGLNDFSGWASDTAAHTVNSGTNSAPITIKNYPSETPILDFSFHGTTGSPSAIFISEKAYWTIDGLEVSGGNINMWGGAGPSADALTHDITIQNCTVHDLTIDGGVNPGLIRVDRSDNGGAYNITVKNNKLYNIFDPDSPGEWHGVEDMQHFGAVTTLSNYDYAGYAGGSTGLITIDGNEIYNVPQAFFFKNAMTGPVEITNNTIYNSDSLGIKMAGNVHMYHNLVYDVAAGFWSSGTDHGPGIDDPLLHDANGANATIEYNTFIGINSILSIVSGTGHTIGHNVFFGLDGRTTGAGWDTTSFITKSSVYQDSTAVSQSLLQQIHSDNNCFIAPYSDFQFAARYMTAGIEHYTYAQARDTFGFDPNSQIIIQSDPAAVFVDPSSHDYRLQNSENCVDMGYYAVAADETNNDTNNDNSETVNTSSSWIITGPKAGGGPQIRIFNRSGQVVSQFYAFEQNFRGGVTVAMADIDGDGSDEVIVGAGSGRAPEVRVFERSGTLVGTFFAFASNFRGGINVAGGDINGDDRDEIIVAPLSGGGPQIRIFAYRQGAFTPMTGGFFAYNNRVRGGVSVTTVDIEGDGTDEIVTVPTSGGGPQILIFGLRSGSFRMIMPGLMAYASDFRGGVTIAGGNIDRDSGGEVITAPVSRGGPHIISWGQSRTQAFAKLSPGWMAFSPQFRGGVSVAAFDTDNDGVDEIVAAVAGDSEPLVRIFSADGRRIITSFFAYDRSFKHGLNVAAGN
jgi:hypothetical protein